MFFEVEDWRTVEQPDGIQGFTREELGFRPFHFNFNEDELGEFDLFLCNFLLAGLTKFSEQNDNPIVPQPYKSYLFEDDIYNFKEMLNLAIGKLTYFLLCYPATENNYAEVVKARRDVFEILALIIDDLYL